jgi:hypothetical protein
MEVISSCYVNVEEEILYPYGRVCGSVVWFNVHGLEAFWELVLHYPLYEAQGVCGAPNSGYITSEVFGHPSPLLLQDSIVSVRPVIIFFPVSGQVFPGYFDGHGTAFLSV